MSGQETWQSNCSKAGNIRQELVSFFAAAAANAVDSRFRQWVLPSACFADLLNSSENYFRQISCQLTWEGVANETIGNEKRAGACARDLNFGSYSARLTIFASAQSA
jgi:hypothetical protein